MSNLKVVEKQVKDSAFGLALVEYMKARADVVQLDVSQPNNDDDGIAVLAALQAAEWKLLQTPSKSLCEIKRRGQVVLEMLADADFGGKPTDNRHHLMVGVLVSELLRAHHGN